MGDEDGEGKAKGSRGTTAYCHSPSSDKWQFYSGDPASGKPRWHHQAELSLPRFLKHLVFILSHRSRGMASSGPGKAGKCFSAAPPVRDVPASQGATHPLQSFWSWERKSKDEGRNQLPHSSRNICDKSKSVLNCLLLINRHKDGSV